MVNQNQLNLSGKTFPIEDISPFFANLLKKITRSLANLSLENPEFFELICLFDSINDPMHLIYWDYHYSRCFNDLVGLDAYQLNFLQDFLDFSEQNLSQDELQLCQDNFLRAKADTEWLLNLDHFYQNIIQTFTPSQLLSSQDIIHPNYQNETLDEAPYLINLLSNKRWETIASNEWLGFLQGYNFYFLSDIAYYFVLPACIKLCIDDFRNQTNDYPFQYVSILLNDKNRGTSANADLKKLVMEFLQIWSYPACFGGNVDDLKEIWQV